MRNLIFSWALGVIAGYGLLAGAPASQAQTAVSPESLKPGLEVCYIYEFIRNISEMAGWEGSRKCKPGEPLMVLNSGVGEGNVLTSDADDGVMARITGFIHLDPAGNYSFAFESNDGVRLEIDGEIIVEDPDVHGDRFKARRQACVALERRSSLRSKDDRTIL